MATTQIIHEHPGYYWKWENNYWQMYWEPVHRVYSPPRLNPEIMMHELYVPLWFQDKIGVLIGRQGHNFIRITQETGCYYIYYLAASNKIEIWGHLNNVVHATKRLKKLMSKIQNNI